MKRFIQHIIGLLAVGMVAMSSPAKQITIGPANPGAEDGSDNWWVGASGTGYLLVDHTDPASDTSDFTLGSTNSDGAEWRSVAFPLGPAAAGAKPITFSFAYKLPDEVKPGDNVLVQLRFFDKATNWISKRDFLLGDSSHDSAMTRYKTVTVTGLRAPPHAEVADVCFNVNEYRSPYPWSSGAARFDNFSVKVTTISPLVEIGVPAVVLLGIAIATVLLLNARHRKRQLEPA